MVFIGPPVFSPVKDLGRVDFLMSATKTFSIASKWFLYNVKCENQIYVKNISYIISHVGLSELSHAT